MKNKKSLKESLKSNKLYKSIMPNFRLMQLIFTISLIGLGFMKLYNLSFINKINSNVNYAMNVFLITGLYFLFTTLFTTIDIIELVFGQKGKNTLLDNAKRR